MDIKRLRWNPKEGLYQTVLPNGVVHIDMFVDGRTPTPVTLSAGDEVELYERELRILKKSEILYMGYLAPIFYYEKDEDGNKIEIEATEDPDNFNVINDNLILVRVQTFKDAVELKDHLDKITSILTANRYLDACELLDTPKSYIDAITSRVQAINEEERSQMYSGNVDGKRKDFLTAKIEK